VLKIFEDQIVGENGTDDYEVESIAEILDLSNITSDISQW